MPGASKRRILTVMHGPLFGGAHNQLVRLDPGLREAGFTSVAVVPPEAEEAARRIEAAGIEAIRMPLSSFRLVRDPRAQARAAIDARANIRSLRRVIRDQRPDLVQVHGVINVHAGIAAALEDTAIAWQILDSRAPMALRRIVMPLVVRLADVITSWGTRLAIAHPGATALGERLVIVFPPLDPTLEPDPAQRAIARERLGVGGDAPLVGTIGVRNATKGHEHLVRSAAIVKRDHPDAVFRVLGAPSPTHRELMASVEAEARALGILGEQGIEFIDPGAEATTLLQAFDVFALTSARHSEGMPTAILEAMACAKPVVATDVGSVGELVADRQTGYLTPAGDPHAIASAIGALLGDPRRRVEVGAAGRERALREFPITQLVERHLTAYGRALEHRDAR